MKKILIPLILIAAVIVLTAASRMIYRRFMKSYEVGKDPGVSEITQAYCISHTRSADSGDAYDKYSVRRQDKKYYAETDLFDEKKRQQIVTGAEITNAEYYEIVRLMDGHHCIRQGRADADNRDAGNSYADILWDHRPNGSWELSLDPETRHRFEEAVTNAVRTITISFVDDVAPSSVWVIRDTPENRKTSIWGTAMIRPEGSGKKLSAVIPFSESGKYLFHMIDENGIYYSAKIPELQDGWELRIRQAGEGMEIRLDITDDEGNPVCECEVFHAAL